MFILFFVASVLSACKWNDNKKIEELVESWMGKELKFDDYTTYSDGNLSSNKEVFKNNKPQIVSYFNTFECLSCIDDLLLWSKVVNKFEQYDIEFVFIIYTNDHQFDHYIKKYLPSWGVTYPIFLDKRDNFRKINDLYPRKFFQTFLLNGNNQVILIGNPLLKDDLMTLYENKIKILQ